MELSQLIAEGCCTAMEHHHPWIVIDESLTGSLVSLVVLVTPQDHIALGSKQLVSCNLCEHVVGSTVTLHDWLVVSACSSRVVLCASSDSQSIVLPPSSYRDFLFVAEVCAGIGGTSFGAKLAGLCPLVALDQCQLSCDLLQLNQFPKVLKGDLQKPKTKAQFHHALEQHRCGLLAGFPCQPFGTLGMPRAFADRRAWTFHSVMDLAFLIQASFVLLECVVGAGQNAVIQDVLDSFCNVMGYRKIVTVLHLHHVLPCYRVRWWCLLVPAWLPTFHVDDLPVIDDFQTLGSIFSFWPCWPKQEEEELELDDNEAVAFSNPDFGTQVRRLDLAGRCPTLLHSMGNQIRDCPCGCRPPLSPNLLKMQGLHGVLVDSQWPDVGLRHLHPREASLLVGLPVDLKLGFDLRASLTQIGQIASPIQAHWILLHLQAALGFLDFDGLQGLQERLVRNHVFEHTVAWCTHQMFVPRTLTVKHVDLSCIHVSLSEPCTAGTLLAAERGIGAIDQMVDVWEDEQPLALTDWIHSDTVQLVSRMGYGGPCVVDGVEVASFQQLDGLDDLTMTQQGRRLMSRAGLELSSFLAPRDLDGLLEAWPATAIDRVATYCSYHVDFHGLLLHDMHWLYFHLSIRSDELQVHWFDGLRTEIPCSLGKIAQLFVDALSLKHDIHWVHSCPFCQTHGQHCGAVALLHMGISLGLWDASDEGTAELWFQQLLARQRRQGFGPNDEAAVLEWLANFLPSKGVLPEDAMGRAKLALKKLGLSALQHAIKQKDPWRALKTAGSAIGKPFQWVSFQELQQHVADRQAHGFKAGNKQKQKRPGNKRSSEVVALSPDTIELFSTTFVDDHEDEVLPIGFSDIASNARGVCVVTTEQALQLCQGDTNLSTDALAVLTIGEFAECNGFPATNMQWPAIYTPTREPILVIGTLVNLGDLAVSMVKATNAPEVSVLDTEVVRVMVYKDQYVKDWESLQLGPVKELIAQLPALNPCTEKGCSGSCKFFHSACDEEVANPVLDVWSWRWASIDNKPTQSGLAETFSVFVRLPSSALNDVLRHSGWNGIFIEPRPASKQGPHPDFSVVWLPKSSNIDQARDYMRRIDQVIGLARMQSKFGLRLKKKDEISVTKLIYPGKEIAVCNVVAVYEVGPLPHGLTHAQVGKLLHAWSWIAKPLRPARSNAAGQFWEIGTSSDPPSAVLRTDQGSVTVSLKKDLEKHAKPAPKIQSSTRTRKHMLGGPASSSQQVGLNSRDHKGPDPWTIADPWKAYVPTTSGDGTDHVLKQNRRNPAEANKKRIDALEERIVSQVKDQIAANPAGHEDVNMEAGGVLSKQATQIVELQVQNKKFEGWFKDIGTRFQAVENKLIDTAQQMNSMSNAVAQQGQATQKLQSDVATLSTSLSSELQAKLDSQTSRLEALLEKRQKS